MLHILPEMTSPRDDYTSLSMLHGILGGLKAGQSASAALICDGTVLGRAEWRACASQHRKPKDLGIFSIKGATYDASHNISYCAAAQMRLT